ncbi:helix-turn-helix transcriptional regulator [Nocardia sp. NBC_00403]|uniref:helix-turn-helix transcriptional regulator n=1 Tax=Nocardia sp. NBC_00403 TaxID=2975990 RepID=UPI002E204D99
MTLLCIQGRATTDIARALGASAYTVQAHLESIFDKTAARIRGELVGQVFLEHDAPRAGHRPSRGLVGEGHCDIADREPSLDRARLDFTYSAPVLRAQTLEPHHCADSPWRSCRSTA